MQDTPRLNNQSERAKKLFTVLVYTKMDYATTQMYGDDTN